MLSLILPVVVFTVVVAEDYVHNPIQYHSQSPKGSYNYGYDTGLFGSHSFHQENKDKNGQVRGRYGYTDPDGKLRLTYYTAGPQGFNVVKETPDPQPAPVTHSDVTTHHDNGPVVHVSSLSRPVPAPCKYRDPPCTQKSLQNTDQHVDEKVSVSYSTSSRATHHQEKQTLVVQPGSEVVHHSAAAVVHNEATPPVEHRHHHAHHRNHDLHEGIVRVPLPAAVAVTHHSEPAIQSSPLVVSEKFSTHRLSKTFVQPPSKTVHHQVISQPEPVKTVTHHVTKVHEPIKSVFHEVSKVHVPIKTVTQHVSKVHEPIEIVQHQGIKIHETVKSLGGKQSLVQSAQKSYLSPSELFRSRSEHHDQVVNTHTDVAKQRYIPNYKPNSSTYSRCYCV